MYIRLELTYLRQPSLEDSTQAGALSMRTAASLLIKGKVEKVTRNSYILTTLYQLTFPMQLTILDTLPYLHIHSQIGTNVNIEFL